MDDAALHSEKNPADEEHAFEELQCKTMVSCAQARSIRTFRARVPEFFRFCFSSFIGCVTMAGLNAVALFILPEAWQPNPAGTIAWSFSYAVSIWAQHWLHSTFVYGWTTSYWNGLIKTYAGYSASYLVSIPLNAMLIYALHQWLNQPEKISVWWAYVLTLLITGAANYLLFQRLLGRPKEPPFPPPDNTNAAC